MTHDLETLARQAADALLAQKLVPVTHPPGWARDGFPLPVKRMPAQPDGSVVQEYRPLAVLEYVHEVLAGAALAGCALLAVAWGVH